MGTPTPAERRHYRRVRAPILVRPAGRVASGKLLRPVGDIGRGGVRAYADEDQPVGTRVEIELLFPGGAPAHVVAEVAWVQRLPPGAPARFEVGMRFLQIHADDVARIDAASELVNDG
ncbi:MAG: PilZ domain-containing protein [Anaeromyxobacteraceae bacterium]